MAKILANVYFRLIWIFSLPPLWVVYAGIKPIAWILRKIIKYRKQVIDENLANSFPEKSGEELLFLSKHNYQWMVRIFFEAVKALHFSCSRLGKRVQVMNPELLKQFAEQQQNIIILAGHTGNWEWSPSAVCPNGFDLLGVYKPQSSKTFDHLTYLIRKKKGVIPIPMKATFREITKAGIPGGKPKALLLIADQIPALGDIHYWNSFLNQPSAWFTGGAKIACKMDLPVLFLKMLQRKPGYYSVEFVPLRYPGDSSSEQEITNFYTHALEETIREQPAHWLWSHRRWKHRIEDVSL